MLAHYDQTLPGLADRIVTMAEEQSRHRREMEREQSRHDSRLESRGQMFGFSIALFSFAAAGALIALDKTLYGMSAVVAAAAGLSGLFVWSRSRSGQQGSAPPERGEDGRRD